MHLGFLYSILRKDEKLLLDELRSRAGIQVTMLNDRELIFDLQSPKLDFDLVFERSISYSRGLEAINILEAQDIICVNTSEVARICGDKIQTSLALKQHQVAQPRLSIAFTPESALEVRSRRYRYYQLGAGCRLRVYGWFGDESLATTAAIVWRHDSSGNVSGTADDGSGGRNHAAGGWR